MFVCCCKISMGCLECSVMALMNSRSRTPSGEDTSLIWDLSGAAQVEAGCSTKWQILGQLLPISPSSPHQGDEALMTSLTPDDGKESGDKLCVLQAWGDSLEFATAAWRRSNQAPVLTPQDSLLWFCWEALPKRPPWVKLGDSSLAYSILPFGTQTPGSPALFLSPDYFQVPLVNCPLASVYRTPGFFSSGPGSHSFSVCQTAPLCSLW